MARIGFGATRSDTAEAGSWFARLRAGLGRTRAGLTGGLADLLRLRRSIDADLLEEIETLLLASDVGVDATQAIIGTLTGAVKRHELSDGAALMQALRAELLRILQPVEAPEPDWGGARPFVVLVVGVNGAGKTTSIGKLAKRLQADGRSVLLAAGDTFRAAAVEQLQVWGERNAIPVIAQGSGADPAAVIHDALDAARARGVDVVLADTAGRLHNKQNLMEELRKVRRVVGKFDARAPHEVLLVLDGGTGQNALAQAREFHAAVGVTGIVLTKLDGTAKGGIVFALAQGLGVPIRYIGVGEGLDDLRPFRAAEFVDALLAE